MIWGSFSNQQGSYTTLLHQLLLNVLITLMSILHPPVCLAICKWPDTYKTFALTNQVLQCKVLYNPLILVRPPVKAKSPKSVKKHLHTFNSTSAQERSPLFNSPPCIYTLTYAKNMKETYCLWKNVPPIGPRKTGKMLSFLMSQP